MKTAILTIVTAISLVAGNAKTTQAATAKDNYSTVLSDVQNISKIEVRGNVELYVSDGDNDNVKVYNRYYSESALVQNQNGVLRISSYKAEKLVVWVTAKDLRNISAYDNADVKSFGTLSAISLDVNLYNAASASLKLDGYSASIQVNDKAKANLSGNVTACDLKYDQTATVNSAEFVAASITRTVDRTTPVKKGDELVAVN